MRAVFLSVVVAACLASPVPVPNAPVTSSQVVTSEIIVGSLNVDMNPVVTMEVEQYTGGQWTPVAGGYEGLSPSEIVRKVLPTNQRIVITFNAFDPPPMPGPTP